MCAYIRTDENIDVNVEVIGGASEIWVFRSTVTVVIPVIASIGVVVGVEVVRTGAGFGGRGGGVDVDEVCVVEVVCVVVVVVR